MIAKADTRPSLSQAGGTDRLEVRSVTGTRYWLAADHDPRVARGAFRTAYGLRVVGNEDGSFTIVDTGTRLLRFPAA